MAIFRKINSSKSANFGAFFHEIPLYKLHWIFWVVKWWKFAPQKMQVAYIHVWLLLTGSMLWMLVVHLKKNQLATYHGSITIPTIIKIFSINVNFFSKNQLLLTMLKVLKICLTLLLIEGWQVNFVWHKLVRKVGNAMCLLMYCKITWHLFFPPHL